MQICATRDAIPLFSDQESAEFVCHLPPGRGLQLHVAIFQCPCSDVDGVTLAAKWTGRMPRA